MMRTPFQYLGLALALSGSVAFPQDKPQVAASSPLPERPVVTEQVLIHEGLPKLVRYSASVPLASLKSYVRLISKGRAALAKSAKSSGFTWPDGLEAGSTSTPALALMSGWESMKGEAKGAKTWVQLDFDLTMEGGLSDVKALVIEHSARGTWALARESEECKQAEAALAGEGRPKNLTVQNSRRYLLVSGDSSLWPGDHFPVGASAHHAEFESRCWRITDRKQGSCLGFEGIVYTLQAATWNKEEEFHKPEEDLERKFLSGIGFIQGFMEGRELKAIEILDIENGRIASGMRESWIEAINRFRDSTQNNRLDEGVQALSIGYMMELLPDEVDRLKKCLTGRRVEKDILIKTLDEIHKELPLHKLVRKEGVPLGGFLSKKPD